MLQQLTHRATNMIRLSLLLFAIGTTLHAQELYTITGLPRTAGIPRCAVAAPDEAFVVCYEAHGIGERPKHQVLGVMKVNGDGVVEWNRLIDVDNGARIDAILPVSIVRTRGGGLIVAANLLDRSSGQSVERGVLLLSINHSGEIVGRHRYEAELHGCDTFALPDGSSETVCRTGRVVEMIAGDEGAVMLIEMMGGAVVMWLDDEGAATSSRTIADAVSAEELFTWTPRALAADSAGGVVVVGSGYRQDIPSNIPLLLRLDGDGDLLRAVSLPGHVDPFLNDVMTLADGRIMLSGMSTIRTRFVSMPMQSIEKEVPIGDVSLEIPARIHNESERGPRRTHIGQPTVWILDPGIAGGSSLIMNMGSEEAWATESIALSGGEIVTMTAETSRAESGPFKEGYAMLGAEGTYLSYSAITPFSRVAPQRLDGTVFEKEARNKRGLRPFGPAHTNDIAPGMNGGLLLVGSDYGLVPFLSFHSSDAPFPCMETRSVPVDTTATRFTVEELPFTSVARIAGPGAEMRIVELSREVGVAGICEPIEE